MAAKKDLAYQPYTYLVGWSKINKWYYGSQYGKKANPVNLWTVYFTSSLKVKKLRIEYGEPDVINIRRVFLSAEETQNWEKKVLKKLNVLHDDKWLNENIAGRTYKKYRPEHSILMKQKYKNGEISLPQKAHKGHFHSTKTKNILKQKAIERFKDKKNHPFWGNTHYEVTSPNGEVFFVREGWSYWCKKQGLNYADLRKVALGKRNHSKGWKAKII